jgi:Zn-dependent protease/predicted transcriptional regulator
MFGKSLTLFEILGFKVKINISWLFLALLIAWSLAKGFFPELYEGLPEATYWWMAVAGLIGLFFSIVFHELSHSLVARRYGLPMKGITLFILGGVAEMEDEPPSAKAEFLMAIAGPIASLVLAAAFYLLYLLAGAAGVAEPLAGVLRYLGLLNLLLAVFNMLPAFPMDGGRAMRAVIWHRTGNLRKATRIAATGGTWLSYGFFGLAVLNLATGNFVGVIWWFLLGMFIRYAAQGSYQQMELRRALEGEPVRRFMTEDTVTVPPDITLKQLVEDYAYRTFHKFFPVIEDGRLVGCVTTARIKESPQESWADTPVRNVMAAPSAENSVGPNEDAMKALSKMQQSGQARLLVAEQGRLLGIVTLKDLMELLSLRMELEG